MAWVLMCVWHAPLAQCMPPIVSAGLKYQDWLPMINMAYIVLTPIAVIFSEALGGGSAFDMGYSERKAAFANFGR